MPSPITLLGEKIAYPEVQLANRVLRVAVLLPDPVRGFCRNPRFDASGIVRRVAYRDHVFFDRVLRPNGTPSDPRDHESGAVGTAGEFGMTAPPGYAGAKPGETFVKIGVGELKRLSGDPYQFWTPYPLVQPGRWQTAVRERDGQPRRVTFVQELRAARGWAYRYETVVELSGAGEPELTITRRLRNTGQRPIVTDHYCHNFAGIGETPIGPDYVCRFPFASTATKPFDAAAVEFAVRQSGGGETRIAPKTVPVADIYGELGAFPATPAANAVTLENRRTGARMRITGDRAPTDIHVWGTDRVLCPEIFVPVRVAPGKETRWTTTYRFFAL